MLYVHANNYDTKIESDYHGKRQQLIAFKRDYYEPFRKAMFAIDFTNPTMDDFNAVSYTHLRAHET